MIGFYPDEGAPFSLAMHMGIAEKDRPVFRARFLTARERSTVAKLIEQAFKAEESADAEGQLAVMDQVMAMVLMPPGPGDRMPAGFEPGKITQFLGYHDCWDLHAAAMEATRLSLEDKKKSAQPSKPSPVCTAPSASTAASEGGRSQETGDRSQGTPVDPPFVPAAASTPALDAATSPATPPPN